ncbi:MAG: hypothetical protein ACR2FU_16470 [Streptosporangiaceae bacterium]
MPDVLVEVSGQVAVVTLNRPEVRNAISAALLTAVRAELAALDDRGDVAAIVSTERRSPAASSLRWPVTS